MTRAALLLLAACHGGRERTLHLPPGADNPYVVEAGPHIDRIRAWSAGKADVLFVVDNSISMVDEQAILQEFAADAMALFLASSLDYHLGVVTSDMDDPGHQGKLREFDGVRWVDDETPGAEAVFAGLLDVGVTGAGNERGIDCAYGALEQHGSDGDGYNVGFERWDATLYIVVVSDDTDYSGMSIDEMSQLLVNATSTATFSSIVGFADPACATTETPGDRYLTLTQSVGGIAWDICDPDWIQVLERLNLDSSDILPPTEYFLSQLPIASTLEVGVLQDGIPVWLEEGVHWTYDLQRNSVVFLDYLPPPGSEVQLSYLPLARRAERP